MEQAGLPQQSTPPPVRDGAHALRLLRTALVTQGLYAWVRNPIFSIIAVSIVGFVPRLGRLAGG